MRTFKYLSLALVAGAAFAAGDAPARPEFFTAAQVDAARAAGDTGTALVTNAEFKVLASRRDEVGQSEIHATDTDIFIVVDGTATLVIGGKIVEPREVAPGEIRGTAIEGGRDYLLEKGVVVTVPRGTPHWVRETRPGFRYFVVKSVAARPSP